MRRVATLAAVLAAGAFWAPMAAANVLLVGSYHGIAGQYSSIQAAIDAASPGDWILIGPGDYKTSSSQAPPGVSDHPAGVLITKANLHLRGMNRNAVIVDGTSPGRLAAAARSQIRTSGRRAPAGR
jgi:pectin methylesterase-like acyl-CoA thioesterase